LTLGNPIYSVLYIDGDQKRRAAFEQAFRQEYHIYTTASGRAALEVLYEKTIQLVLASERLPDMPGIRVLEEIMSEHPNCTRMILTHSGKLDHILRAVERGIVFQVVTSPWKRDDLKITIDGALELYFLKTQNRNLENYLEDIRQSLERKVMARTRKVEQQRRNITDSIHYASRIQKALMLSPGELDELLPTHFLLNKPKDIVSGDFYWASRKNGRLIMAVVDCTGHGVPGAFMSILGISLLNEIVSKMEDPRPGEILNELRKQVIRALGQTGRVDEAREGMEMALCIVDFEEHVIQFSGAYSPLYLVSQGELTEIKGDRMPIGIYHDREVPFTSKEVPFSENDIIYLFSDGYVDQLGGLDRKTFKSGRLKKLIREIWDKPMEEQQAVLREEHEIWRAGQEQIDDLMVLGVKLAK
jgi:serine phosphatase RsbU (regulator of sigma subunit)